MCLSQRYITYERVRQGRFGIYTVYRLSMYDSLRLSFSSPVQGNICLSVLQLYPLPFQSLQAQVRKDLE
jgi:hypothetical protein